MYIVTYSKTLFLAANTKHYCKLLPSLQIRTVHITRCQLNRKQCLTNKTETDHDDSHLVPWNVPLEMRNQQTVLTALTRQGTWQQTLHSPMATPPAVWVNTRYANSIKGISSETGVPPVTYIPSISGTLGEAGEYRHAKKQFLFKIQLSPSISKLAQHMVVALVAFSSLVRILGECSTIHSPPALFF